MRQSTTRTTAGLWWSLVLTAWAASAFAQPATLLVKVAGVVVGPDGEPRPGAWVTCQSTGLGDPQAIQTGDDGRFEALLPAGEYKMAVTAPGLVAEDAAKPLNEDVELVIQLAAEGRDVQGRITDENGRPLAGALVQMVRSVGVDSTAFHTATDDKGRYAFRAPPGPGKLFVVIDDDAYVGRPRAVDEEAAAAVPLGGSRGENTVDLTVSRKEPAPEAVVAWIRERAAPLETVEAGSGFDDLAALRSLVGDARVVGLGEATHGTREFFQLKHRFVEFLVEEMGFNVFAIEANWTESLAIDDYVVNGEGDVREALKGIYFWTWNTEEVLALVEWMRAYNADPAHTRKLRFYGFDMQVTPIAAQQAAAYLATVDKDFTAQWAPRIAPLGVQGARAQIAQSDEAGRTEVGGALDDALARFDAERDAWIAKSSELEWQNGRRNVVLLRQAFELYSNPERGFDIRDRSMAENIRYILDAEPGTKVVAWSHNGHIGRGFSFATSMGDNLTEMLDDDYVAVGFTFHRGSFQAMDWTEGRGRPGGVQEHTIGKAPTGSYGETFARAGQPLFLLDLRGKESEAARWFAGPHVLRAIGGIFSSEKAMETSVVLPENYDAVVFVDETSRARPLGQ